MKKNYYAILGVTPQAGIEDIKAAFRHRAMELHPDISGLESEPFLEIKEAYGVLADPEQRRDYDLIIAAPTPRGQPLRDVSITESYTGFHPSFDEIFDRWRVNFHPSARPKGETLQSLTVEIVVRPQEALFGGRVLVEIPTRTVCPACAGRGEMGRYECRQCEGHGVVDTVCSVTVRFPPGIHDGYSATIPLDRYGIENFFLKALFRVTEWEWRLSL